MLSRLPRQRATCSTVATVRIPPDQVVQNGDIVYLLSSVNHRVYRWSISSSAYLNPYVVGIDRGSSTIAPTTLCPFPARSRRRLYLGYSAGAIHFIDIAGTGAEVHFAATARPVKGIAGGRQLPPGPDGSASSSRQYVFNASGVITAERNWSLYSPDYAADPVNSRVYFLSSSWPRTSCITP